MQKITGSQQSIIENRTVIGLSIGMHVSASALVFCKYLANIIYQCEAVTMSSLFIVHIVKLSLLDALRGQPQVSGCCPLILACSI